MPATHPAGLSLALLTAVSSAQTAVTPPTPPARAMRFVSIAQGSPTEAVHCVRFAQHGMAPGTDDALFVPLVRATWSNAERQGNPRSSVELWRSDDRGASWRRAAILAAENAGDAAIVSEPGGQRLHCTWTAALGGFSSVLYQAYDVATDAPLASPQLVAKGTAAELQYNAYDIERGPDGTIAICVGNHRETEAPWTSSWSSGIYWLKPDAEKFAGPLQLNPDYTGCCGTLQVCGNRIGATYRTVRNSAVIGLRWFDLATTQLVGETDQQVSAAGQESNNCSVSVVDGSGGLTVLYVAGQSVAGQGRLMLAYSANGRGEEWTHTELAQDPPLCGGNYNDSNFVLVRGPGPQSIAYYTKLAENHTVLYARTVEGGRPVSPEKVVAKDEAAPIVGLTGMRSSVAISSLHLVVSRRGPGAPHGEVLAYGLVPARTTWMAR